MKKYIKISILFLSLLLLPSCSKDTNKKIEINLDKEMNINFNTYYDDNPITVGLYEDEYLIKEYNTKITNMKDITVFNIYYTNKEVLENNYIKYNFNKYKNEYTNIDIDKYKIGFIISFEADGKLYKEQILTPDCEYLFAPYLYIYLYDDVHQKSGTWYSHLLPEQVNDETVFSSIKLFMANEATKISSPITLTVFTYDNDDFDKDGNYIGKSKYTVTINQK